MTATTTPAPPAIEPPARFPGRLGAIQRRPPCSGSRTRCTSRTRCAPLEMAYAAARDRARLQGRRFDAYNAPIDRGRGPGDQRLPTTWRWCR